MRKVNEFVEEIENILIEDLYKPLYPKDMKLVINLSDDEEENYNKAMEELESKGSLMYTEKGKCISPELLGVVVGDFQKTSKGFGFVIPKNNEHEDIFIAKSKIKGAMNRDLVAVKVKRKVKYGEKPEGEIVKIIHRNNEKPVCTFFKRRSHGFAIPVDKKTGEIFIRTENSMGAEDQDKVVLEIIQGSFDKDGKAEGRVVEILGHKNEKGINVLSILREYGFKSGFEENVLKEAARIPSEIDREGIKERRDLRKDFIFTIDGNDTKDIDDAVSIEKSDDIYRLGVHIADVSHYVTDGSALDIAAYERGTSVYPVDRVAPMLPVELSNGICSLNPNVDRFTLSVSMDIDSKGNVINHDIFKSVIHSCEQMTYSNVFKILEEENDELLEKYAHIVPSLKLMKELSLILREKRFERGAIDFNVPEAKIVLDDNDCPVEIDRREITIANRMIEEMMLVCNETVAEHFYWLDIPFLYRVHEEPDEDKLRSFCEFINIMGYRMKGNNVHSSELQNLLLKVKGKKEERIISTIMLRAMQKAKYTNEHYSHYGLGAEYYTHFTSPIRRYPDLMIHRLMSYTLKGEMTEKKTEHYKSVLNGIANHCSEKERSAETAERESVKLKMAEYMQDHLGEEFECIISGVTGFGMFLETENLIEGLVTMDSMYDDYYIFDDRQYSLTGERTGKKYRIGDKVRAQVAAADTITRTIEFVIDLKYN